MLFHSFYSILVRLKEHIDAYKEYAKESFYSILVRLKVGGLHRPADG